MAAVTCDKFGFFNGIYALEQTNWSYFFHWMLPAGVIANCENELEVYAQGDGMQVYVKTGQAMVLGHRVWVSTSKTLTISAANASNPRIDLVVCRIICGNDEASTAELDVKTGTPAANPTAPTTTSVFGGTSEIPLAEVYVAAGAVTISASNVTDRRRLYASNIIRKTFATTSVSPLACREYACTSALASLTVNLPSSPQVDYITSVSFPSGSSFSGITVKKGSTTISGTSSLKLKGDALNLASKTYELVFWWDGTYYWCASAAA